MGVGELGLLPHRVLELFKPDHLTVLPADLVTDRAVVFGYASGSRIPRHSRRVRTGRCQFDAPRISPWGFPVALYDLGGVRPRSAIPRDVRRTTTGWPPITKK
jgi:hypothetical protein